MSLYWRKWRQAPCAACATYMVSNCLYLMDNVSCRLALQSSTVRHKDLSPEADKSTPTTQKDTSFQLQNNQRRTLILFCLNESNSTSAASTSTRASSCSCLAKPHRVGCSFCVARAAIISRRRICTIGPTSTYSPLDPIPCQKSGWPSLHWMDPMRYHCSLEMFAWFMNR